MRFDNSKAFLTSLAINHWGTRSEIVGLEVHDAIRSSSVFGQVYLEKLHVVCRSARAGPTGVGIPRHASGAGMPKPNSWLEDLFWLGDFTGFQWYEENAK